VNELLQFRHVSKRYDSKTVVDAVSFSVRSGRITGLLGPNGSGKTTLVRMALGLASTDDGDVMLQGRPYMQHENPVHAVGVLLESAGLHPRMTARRHLRIAALRIGVGRARLEAVLAEVGLSAVADSRIKAFSLGMRQRLGLATALLGEPRLLVLDEPSNGLDPEGMRWLRGFLRSFADAGGAVLLTSHHLAEMTRVIDDVVILREGHVIVDRPLESVDGPDLEALYLDAMAHVPDDSTIGGHHASQ